MNEYMQTVIGAVSDFCHESKYGSSMIKANIEDNMFNGIPTVNIETGNIFDFLNLYENSPVFFYEYKVNCDNLRPFRNDIDSSFKIIEKHNGEIYKIVFFKIKKGIMYSYTIYDDLIKTMLKKY